MGFPHNRVNEDDDKDSNTIYCYVCMLLYAILVERKMHAWKSSNNNQYLYDIYVENASEGMQMVY